MDSPLPSTLKELNHAIQKLNATMLSLSMDSEREQSDEVQRLQHRKHCQLIQMMELKNTELEKLQRRFCHNTSMQREREREIAMFRDFCESELENMKWEKSIQQRHDQKENVQHHDNVLSVKFEIDSSFSPYDVKHTDSRSKSKQSISIKKTKRSNGRMRTRSATRKRSHFVRSTGVTGVMESCLNDDEIEMDLQYLWDKAKEVDIELPDDFIVSNSKRQKKPKQRSIPVVATSDGDFKRIQSICSALGIDLLDRALSVRLYGYGGHLDVYNDIFKWTTNLDHKQQRDAVNELSSGKLRDIQVKLRSPGTVGRKQEMAKGIQQTLKTLTTKYKRESD